MKVVETVAAVAVVAELTVSETLTVPAAKCPNKQLCQPPNS